jgi:hypothetical protein
MSLVSLQIRQYCDVAFKCVAVRHILTSSSQFRDEGLHYVEFKILVHTEV